jgi:hypothetical protein
MALSWTPKKKQQEDTDDADDDWLLSRVYCTDPASSEATWALACSRLTLTFGVNSTTTSARGTRDRGVGAGGEATPVAATAIAAAAVAAMKLPPVQASLTGHLWSTVVDAEARHQPGSVTSEGRV